MLVGIDDFVQRGDLRDRSVFMNLPAIPSTRRRTERSFWPAFQADYPRILGGVLDAIAGGMRELPSVNVKTLPRMADYAEWGEAVGRGWVGEPSRSCPPTTTTASARPNRCSTTRPWRPSCSRLARQGVNWTGPTQKLYERSPEATRGVPIGPELAQRSQQLRRELRRIAPQLRVHGIAVDFVRTRDARLVTLNADGYTKSGSQSHATGA